jgi:hypothetical protein
MIQIKRVISKIEILGKKTGAAFHDVAEKNVLSMKRGNSRNLYIIENNIVIRNAQIAVTKKGGVKKWSKFSSSY